MNFSSYLWWPVNSTQQQSKQRKKRIPKMCLTFLYQLIDFVENLENWNSFSMIEKGQVWNIGSIDRYKKEIEVGGWWTTCPNAIIEEYFQLSLYWVIHHVDAYLRDIRILPRLPYARHEMNLGIYSTRSVKLWWNGRGSCVNLKAGNWMLLLVKGVFTQSGSSVVGFWWASVCSNPNPSVNIWTLNLCW